MNLRCRLARQAKVRGGKSDFVVVFAAMGITNDEAQHFIRDFEETGAFKNTA